MKQSTLTLVTLSFIALAAACSPLSPVDTGRANIFALSPLPDQRTLAPRHERLTVALPSTLAALDSYRIALLRNGKWDYYADARWADFLPVVVQDLLVDSISAAGIFSLTTTDQSPTRGDFILNTEIRDFNTTYVQGIPTAQVSLAVTLRPRTGETLSSTFVATGKARASEDSLPAVQAAFNKAFHNAQTDVIAGIRRHLPLYATPATASQPDTGKKPSN